ncbi:hypothetical protein BG000_006984 [Podila horticola]|nr:hypothetical protein BG000_006984 [Podila horticola]
MADLVHTFVTDTATLLLTVIHLYNQVEITLAFESDSETSAVSDQDDVVMKGADADVVINKNDTTTYFQAADPAKAKSAAENDDPEGVSEPGATGGESELDVEASSSAQENRTQLMVTKLKVIDYNATKADLQELFQEYFEPQEAVFEEGVVEVFDHGFLNSIGFVRFQDKDTTAKALAEKDKALVGGRNIRLYGRGQ